MKSKKWFIIFFTLQSIVTFSQSISSSPYSIFGLGSLYDSDFGSISSLGSSGIALPSSSFINNKNPASLAEIGKHSFFFDFGAKGTLSTYESVSSSATRNNFQFSHIAIAFPLTPKSGLSLSLKPYSGASYTISNYPILIENSGDEYYYLDVNSTGGLNNFDISYGYKIKQNITLGATASAYFGTIKDNKTYAISDSATEIDQNNSYKGLRITLGNQVKIDSTLNLGFTLKSPAKINATKTESVTTVSTTQTTYVEEDENSDGTAYYLPFEIALGFNKNFKRNISLSVDYEHSFWNLTNQSSIYGNYVNQDKIGVGLSYVKNEYSIKYTDRIHYFTGANYDTGYLEINNNRVKNRSFSLGVGIPIDNTKTLLNLTYSYGQQGNLGNGLIKESYHKIDINLSFEAIWFQKRKFD